MKFVIKPLLILNCLLLSNSKPVKVPFDYETHKYQASFYRPGSSSSYSPLSSVTQFQQQNRPSAGNTYFDTPYSSRSSTNSRYSGSSSSFSNNNNFYSKPDNDVFARKFYTNKFSTSNFNRLPAKPEFDDYTDIDDGSDNGVDSGEEVTGGQGSTSQQQYYPGGGGYLGTFTGLKKKKRRGVICVPQGYGYGGGGWLGGLLNPFGGFGRPFGGFGLFRSNEDGQDIESRQIPEDPRFLIKAPQFNFYNGLPYGGGNLYKPSSGYPCRPVNFYGTRPGFGQFGYFSDTAGGNRPEIQNDDVPSRPGGALGILSDTVKPIVESTAIQDGIGSTISNWSPGQGIANVLNAVGGITGQFATAPVAAVKQTQQIYRDFRDLLF